MRVLENRVLRRISALQEEGAGHLLNKNAYRSTSFILNPHKILSE
jgi:hypothetical protein